jgi:hypothetical protein
MPHRSVEPRWRDRESEIHLPVAQDIIREEIHKRTIRIRPKPGGGVLIVPIDIPDEVEVRDIQPLPTQSQTETSPLRRAVRRRQLVRH